MKILVSLICVCLLPTSCCQSWKLVFEDTFDKLDPAKWDHEVTMWGSGNGEFQTYTPDTANTYVRDNTLYIKPTLTKDNINPLTGKPFGEAFLYNEMYGRCTMAQNNGCYREGKNGILPPTMSGRIRTKDRFSFKFGRLEVVAKMPVGDWIWPAIWLLPEKREYGNWPRSGEVDIVESRGNRNLRDNGNMIGFQRIGSALHWGPSGKFNKFNLTNTFKYNSSYNFGDYFHSYALDWDMNGLRFAVDGEEFTIYPNPLIHENPNWKGFWDYGLKNGGMGGLDNPWVNGTLMSPFDKEFHILLNAAIGGTNGYFPDSGVNNGNESKPWNNTGPGNKMDHFWKARKKWAPTWQGEDGALQIKSIRVYQIDNQPTTDRSTTMDGSNSVAPVIKHAATPIVSNSVAPVIKYAATPIVAILVTFFAFFSGGNLL